MTAPGTDRRITLTSVVTIIVPTVAPLAMGAAVFPLAQGRPGFPVALAAAGLVLLALVAGQVTMIRRIANGANFTAIVASGLGRPAGLGTAWLSLAVYGGLQIALYGLVGSATNQLLGQTLPWWLPALAVWALVTASGFARAQLPRHTTEPGRRWGLIVLTCLEIGSIAAIVLVGLLGQQGPASLDAAGLLTPGAGVLVLPVLFALAGVETSARFAESGGSRGALGAAVSIVVSTALLTTLTWALGTGSGERLLTTPGYAGLILSSVLAALVSGQATVVRHLQLLRLEWVRPGDLPRSSGVPATAGFAAVCLAVIVLTGVLGGAPATVLLRRLGMISAYGLLFLLALTALATVAYLGQQPGRFSNVLRPVMAPAVATLALGGLLAVAVGELDRVLGVAPSAGLAVAIAVPCIVALGAGWSLVVRQRWPYRYWAIGLGANSLTGVALPDQVSAPPYAAAHTLALPAPARRMALLGSLRAPRAFDTRND